MKIGANEIQKVYLGTTELDGLYFGTNEAYSKGGGLDENTIGLWHFENNNANAVSGSNITLHPTYSALSYSSTRYKFGDYGAIFSSDMSYYLCDVFSNISSIFSGDFTWDFWEYANTNMTEGSKSVAWYVKGTDVAIILLSNKLVRDGSGTKLADVTTSAWHHIAIERYNGTMNVYCDGVKCLTVDGTSPTALQRAYGKNAYFDEMRLSNVARYQGQDFTPPAQPY